MNGSMWGSPSPNSPPPQIQIAAGRLWDGPTGKIYDLAEAQTVSVQTNLPVADERWLAVSVVGQQVDAAQTVVSILIDAENEDWESQTEYTEKHRQAAVHITAGIEAPDPQKPTVPTGYLLIGYVRLTTTGVAEIQMAENQILKSLWEVYQQVLGHQVMLDVIEPKISTLISDLAQLGQADQRHRLPGHAHEPGSGCGASERPGRAGQTAIRCMAVMITWMILKATLAMPEYLARVDEGIRFAWAGQTEQQPALFNTYDASVTDFGRADFARRPEGGAAQYHRWLCRRPFDFAVSAANPHHENRSAPEKADPLRPHPQGVHKFKQLAQRQESLRWDPCSRPTAQPGWSRSAGASTAATGGCGSSRSGWTPGPNPTPTGRPPTM